VCVFQCGSGLLDFMDQFGRKETYVDDINDPLGVFGFTAAMSSDVDVAFRDEDVSWWHGDVLNDILVQISNMVFA